MPDWPTLERVDDRRYAHALREGDATDVAHVYSGYAEPLFDYCHALLRDQQEAAAALHDTFVAAHAHISRLSDPERFRSWMYALARNEAIRRLNDPERPAERQEAPEVDHSFESADERSRRQEGRELMHSALSALTGRQRETIDLMLRHRLEAQDLTGILGIGAQEAGRLATESRGRLEDALAAAAIARTGSGDCPSVSALMESGGWPLTPSLARKLVRHIDSCPVCGEQRKRKPSAARLIETLPVAMLPAELQRSVLTTVTSPDLAAERAAIAAGAEPLDEHGWPAPVGVVTAARDERARRRGAAAVWPVAAAAIMVMVIGSVLIWLPAGSDRSSAQSTASPGTGVLDASQSPPASPGDSGSPEPSPTPTVSASPSPTPTVSRTPTPTPSVSKTPTPTPTKKSPKPVIGHLVLVSNGCAGPIAMTAGTDGNCTVTVRAVGGPVTWTAAAGGGVTVQGGGRLAKGATATAAVTIPAGLCGTGTGGSGTGSVTVAAKGSASNAVVNWTCPSAAAADPSSGPAPAAGAFTA